MGLFSKAKKYRKLSCSIDEKVKLLNKELEKTGVVLETAPANNSTGLYVELGDQPEENEDIAALKDAAAEVAGVTDFEYLPQESGSTSPDGTTRNNLFQGYGMWGPEDTPTMWWKNANGYWNWMAWIPYNFYTQNPGGTSIAGGGWGVHSSTMFGAVGVPGVGGVGGSSVPSEIEAKIKDENGDYITPDKFDAPPGPPPVLFQGGLGDPDYFPGDPQKDKSKEEEEAENEIKNQLGVGDEGLEAIKNQASGDSEEGYSREYDDRDNEDAEEDEEDKEKEKDKKYKEALDKKWETIATNTGITLKAFHWLLANNTAWGQVLTKLDDIVTGDSGIEALDKLLDPIAHAAGKALGKGIGAETAANIMFRYDTYLADGETGRVDVTNDISDEDMKKLVSAAYKPTDLYHGSKTHQEWLDFFQEKGDSSEEALEKLASKVAISIQAECKKSGTALSMTFHNNVQLDKERFIESGGKDIRFTKTYKFAEKTGSVKSSGFADSKLGHLLTGMGVELDRFGTGKKAALALVGSRYGLRHINREYDGKADSAAGMPMEVTIPNPDANWDPNANNLGNQAASYGSDKDQKLRDIKKQLYKTGAEKGYPVQRGLNLRVWHEPEGEVLSEGWASPKHTDVDKDEKKRWFNPKEIHPDYPREAPPKMVGGWHPDLKKNDETPISTKQYIKIKEVDLIKNYRMKGDVVKKFMNTINSINSYLTRNPSALIHAQQRYPKSDPHLAALNYKMDMQLAAADEYMERNFPENQRLYDRLIKATKKSIKLTDPKTYKDKKGKMTSYNKLLRVRHSITEYDPVDKEVKNRKIGYGGKKKSAGRFFKKSKKKSKDDILKDKMAILDKEMKKTMPDQ